MGSIGVRCWFLMTTGGTSQKSLRGAAGAFCCCASCLRAPKLHGFGLVLGCRDESRPADHLLCCDHDANIMLTMYDTHIGADCDVHTQRRIRLDAWNLDGWDNNAYRGGSGGKPRT